MKVVFAGPSIYPGAPVRASYHDFAWRGPARQGDIVRAVRDGAAAIALIDGLYGTLAAVWHKEILFALSEGVHVIGGASLGALRAAECWPFGMEGVGSIFNEYQTGSRVDDGDVALLHAPPEMDHAPLTEAIVDLQATLRALHDHGLISVVDARRIDQAVVEIFFWDRTLEAVLDRAGFSEAEADAMFALMESNRVQAKRTDALLVLDRLALSSDQRGVQPTAWTVSATRSLRRIASASKTAER